MLTQTHLRSRTCSLLLQSGGQTGSPSVCDAFVWQSFPPVKDEAIHQLITWCVQYYLPCGRFLEAAKRWELSYCKVWMQSKLDLSRRVETIWGCNYTRVKEPCKSIEPSTPTGVIMVSSGGAGSSWRSQNPVVPASEGGERLGGCSSSELNHRLQQ